MGTSRVGSFAVPAVSTFGNLVDEFSINPITGDSGADRVVPSEPLYTQLQKSWIWSFSCAGRYWTLAKQNSKSESWGKQDAIKEYQILTGQHRDEDFFSATKLQEFPSASYFHQKQHIPKSEAYNTMTYNFSAKKQKSCKKIKNFNYKYSAMFPKNLPMYSREGSLPKRVLEASKTCQSCRVLFSISWVPQTEPLVLATF